jgi:thiamine-phosphate pyrophosphorylase
VSDDSSATIARAPSRPGAPSLYIITDRRATNGRALLTVLAQALEGAADAGVTAGTVAIQLREKDLEARALLDLAHALRALTTRFGAALYINDRIDVALAARADGVHLAGNSVSPSDVSAIAPSLAVAVSTHAAHDLEWVKREPNVRFAVLGPIYDTPAKRRFGPPLGLSVLAAATNRTRDLPVLAIGGITVENYEDCRASGAAGVAVIRAILAANDPKKVAFSFFQPKLEVGPTQ